jgi:hypothetical protein
VARGAWLFAGRLVLLMATAEDVQQQPQQGGSS